MQWRGLFMNSLKVTRYFIVAYLLSIGQLTHGMWSWNKPQPTVKGRVVNALTTQGAESVMIGAPLVAAGYYGYQCMLALNKDTFAKAKEWVRANGLQLTLCSALIAGAVYIAKNGITIKSAVKAGIRNTLGFVRKHKKALLAVEGLGASLLVANSRGVFNTLKSTETPGRPGQAPVAKKVTAPHENHAQVPVGESAPAPNQCGTEESPAQPRQAPVDKQTPVPHANHAQVPAGESAPAPNQGSTQEPPAQRPQVSQRQDPLSFDDDLRELVKKLVCKEIDVEMAKKEILSSNRARKEDYAQILDIVSDAVAKAVAKAVAEVYRNNVVMPYQTITDTSATDTSF